MSVAEALVEIDGKDPHWASAAQDLVAGLIMQEVCEGGDKASLRTVRAMLTAAPERLAKGCLMASGGQYKSPDGSPKAGRVRHPAIPNKLQKFGIEGLASNRELMSVISTAQTQTRFLDSEPIIADLEKPGVRFDQLKKKPMTVYVVLPPARMRTHAKWMRLVIDGAIRALQQSLGGNVLMMLDEFAQLGHMESIAASMALNAGYGLKVMAVVQSLSQLEHLYGREWEGFLTGGLGASLAPRDVMTSEHLSKLSGQEWVKTAGRTQTDRGDASASVNESLQASILPHQFRRMPRGMMIAFIPTDEGQVMRRIMARDFSQIPEVAQHIQL